MRKYVLLFLDIVIKREDGYSKTSIWRPLWIWRKLVLIVRRSRYRIEIWSTTRKPFCQYVSSHLAIDLQVMFTVHSKFVCVLLRHVFWLLLVYFMPIMTQDLTTCITHSQQLILKKPFASAGLLEEASNLPFHFRTDGNGVYWYHVYLSLVRSGRSATELQRRLTPPHNVCYAVSVRRQYESSEMCNSSFAVARQKHPLLVCASLSLLHLWHERDDTSLLTTPKGLEFEFASYFWSFLLEFKKAIKRTSYFAELCRINVKRQEYCSLKGRQPVYHKVYTQCYLEEKSSRCILVHSSSHLHRSVTQAQWFVPRPLTNVVNGFDT